MWQKVKESMTWNWSYSRWSLSLYETSMLPTLIDHWIGFGKYWKTKDVVYESFTSLIKRCIKNDSWNTTALKKVELLIICDEWYGMWLHHSSGELTKQKHKLSYDIWMKVLLELKKEQHNDHGFLIIRDVLWGWWWFKEIEKVT